MKLKILLICLLALGAGMQYASANTKPAPKNNSEVIQYFIDSHMNADHKTLDMILDDDASYKISAQNKLITHSRSALINAMKGDKGIVQNCTSSFEIIKQTDVMTLARVDFKYPGFNQQNILLIEKGAGDTWKISRVYKFFDDAAPGKSPVANTN